MTNRIESNSRTHGLFGPGRLLDNRPAHFVDGRFIGSDEPASDVISVVDPSSGETIIELPIATPELVDEAVRAAVSAQAAWARTSHQQRAVMLDLIRTEIALHADDIAHIVVTEQGKPLRDAMGEVGGAQKFFEYAASQRFRDVGEIVAAEPGRQIAVSEYPVGVVAAILPWNFPAAIFARKVAPALMAGNAVIVKPSELTPLSALALARVCQMAGLADGLVQVLCGDGPGTGASLVTHEAIGMVTMTGSTRGGRQILEQCAPQIIPVSLELGGKAPFIVFADADLERAVDDAVDARLWNSGQVCTCNEVTYVHESVADEFTAALVERFTAITPRHPLDPESTMGPLVSDREVRKVADMVAAAVNAGAHLAVGGGAPAGVDYASGNWFAPTILTDVKPDMDIARQEIFGPVLPIVRFTDDDDVIGWANSTAYGLTAYVYTADVSRAMRAIDDLEFGEVYINSVGPEQVQGFHTGWKASGMGGDDGAHGYERYVRRKTTYIDYGSN